MVKQETVVLSFSKKLFFSSHQSLQVTQRNVGWGRAQLGRLMSGLPLLSLLSVFMRDLVRKDVDSMPGTLPMAGTWAPSQRTRWHSWTRSALEAWSPGPSLEGTV